MIPTIPTLAKMLEDGPFLSVGDFSAAMNLVAAAKDKIKEVSKWLDERMIEYIKAHGEIVVGTMRYWVGNPPKVKSRSNSLILKTLYELGEGDEQVLLDCLSADAFKHGAIRALLESKGKADLYDKLFETTYGNVLKSGEVPQKRLMSADANFVKTKKPKTKDTTEVAEISHCAQCGWSGEGHHACPGLPGENQF